MSNRISDPKVIFASHVGVGQRGEITKQDIEDGISAMKEFAKEVVKYTLEKINRSEVYEEVIKDLSL